MHQTWRWCGPQDQVRMEDVAQAGASGIVSALHLVPTGEVWSQDAIRERQSEVARFSDGTPSGLRWDVVESLPVSEDIKQQRGEWRTHLANYKENLSNIVALGIETICYNFMPVLDWTRTDLAYRRPNGATCMRFDLLDFAAFDIHILARPGASEDYTAEQCENAAARFAELSDGEAEELARTITCGLPGAAETFSLDDVRAHLARYEGISAERLRQHLIDFLSDVAPVAEKLGLRLCCHPDDPPFPLMGLPRVMSCEADYAAIMEAVDVPANGITLCSGSLGVRHDADLPGMMARLGDRVHFLHLRNVMREEDTTPCSFFEDERLAGGTDMVALIDAVLAEEARRRTAGRVDADIPFRPDHGQDILDDLTRRAQPGYPAIGRLKGLAELRGVITALKARAAWN